MKLLLLTLVASTDALIVRQASRPTTAAAVQLATPRACAESGTVEQVAPEPTAVDDSKFMRWYMREKRREKYEAENPVDPFERIKSPAISMAFILLGFNLGPIISKIYEITGVTAPSLPSFGGGN